jgi:hypothetical protein
MSYSASSKIVSGQTTLSTNSAVGVALRAGRHRATVRNTHASIIVWVGDGGAGSVSNILGVPLKPDEAWTFETSAAIYAIAESGAPVLAWVEEYD